MLDGLPPRTSFERVLFLIERTCTCHLHYAYTLLLFPSPLSHHSCLVKFARIKTALAAWIRLNPVPDGTQFSVNLFVPFASFAAKRKAWGIASLIFTSKFSLDLFLFHCGNSTILVLSQNKAISRYVRKQGASCGESI